MNALRSGRAEGCRQPKVLSGPAGMKDFGAMIRARQRGFAFGAEAFRALAGGAVMAAVASQAQAQAACDTTADPVSVGADCQNFLLNSAKTAVTIGPSATVSAFSLTQKDGVLINPGGSVTGTFLNQGRITFGLENNALVNRGTISTLINQNQIIGRQEDRKSVV